MAKPDVIELDDARERTRIPILFEDRSVIAMDKPAGWMLVPFTWQRTNRNLQAAITSSVAARHFWAKSRNLKFLRHIHRLDADTTGVLLFGKSLGAVQSYGAMFESRLMRKRYLVTAHGSPRSAEWVCQTGIGPDPAEIGKMKLDARDGKSSETAFRVLARKNGLVLIEASPVTGRTHQIRLHLLESDLRIPGDDLYGSPKADGTVRWDRREFPMGLRAVSLEYQDPFTRRHITIRAPVEGFLRAFGFDGDGAAGQSPTGGLRSEIRNQPPRDPKVNRHLNTETGGGGDGKQCDASPA